MSALVRKKKKKAGYLAKKLIKLKLVSDVTSANAVLILTSLVLLFVSTVLFTASALSTTPSSEDRVTGFYNSNAAHASQRDY